MSLVIVVLDRDTELVPGLTKAQLRSIAERTRATLTNVKGLNGTPMFDPAEAEAGIAAREERKAAARA